MEIINAKFVSFAELPVFDLIGAVGVYCLWWSTDDKEVDYIGEGSAWDRIGSHAKKYGSELKGCVAILGYDHDDDVADAKHRARVLESALLATAEFIGIDPLHNKARAATTPVLQRFLDGAHGTIRLNLSGRDPLRWRKLPQGKTVISLKLRGENIIVDFPFRRSSR